MKTLPRMRKTAKLLAALFVMAILVSLTAVPAFAAEALSGSGIAAETAAQATESKGDLDLDVSDRLAEAWGLNDPENQIHIQGNVTTDQVNQWVERKGGDIISILQAAGKIVCIIGFFASIICVVVGAIGNKRMMTGGFIGVLISLCCYVALTQGREIISLFSSWVMS